MLAAMQLLTHAVEAPAKHWILGDDLCDCLFQRIWDTNNPHIGRTLRVRECCLWKTLYEQYPEYVQVLPYYDPNRHIYVSEPEPWNSDEMDMPVYLWHRQLAIEQGKTVAQIREDYAGREHERPRKVKSRKESRPTKAEVKHATEMRLRASGWITEGEPLPEIVRKQLAEG